MIRHSDATVCTIELDVVGAPGNERVAVPRVAVLRMENDGVRPAGEAGPSGPRGGTGLVGLGERLAGVGGTLTAAEQRLRHVRRRGPRPRLRLASGDRREPGDAPARDPERAVIRLLLADDENLIRSALVALLSMEDDVTVVAQAASGPEALAMSKLHRPDVAVLDLADARYGRRRRRRGAGPRPARDAPALIVTSHGRPWTPQTGVVRLQAYTILPKTVSGARARRRSCVSCTRAGATWTRSSRPRRSAPARQPADTA